jgi:ferredoxin
MKIEVDRARCEGHGSCTAVAPEVYDLDDDAVVVVRVRGAIEGASAGEIPAELASDAEAGALACPVAALRVSR